MCKKIKIVIIHNIAWSHYRAGILFNFYKLLKSHNLELKVINIALTNKDRIKLSNNIDLSNHKYPFNILFNDVYEKVPIYKKIYRLIIELIINKPNIVIICGYDKPEFIAALLISKIIKAKTIIDTDTTYFQKSRSWYKEIVKKSIIRLFDYGFPRSNFAKDYLCKLGLKKEKQIIVPHATCYFKNLNDKFEIDKIKKKYKINTNKNFIFVGRLIKLKNLQLLIEAFSMIKKSSCKSNKWGLILVGEGEEKEYLENLVKLLFLSDVFFVGAQPWDIIPYFYAISDVFILPSTSESWGLVVNEAMMHSLPMIVSNRVGASEIVKEGENGFIFDPYRIDTLINIMLKIINEEVDIKKMGIVANRTIKNYTSQYSAEKMFEGIKNII